jgi:hypothetical protein
MHKSKPQKSKPINKHRRHKMSRITKEQQQAIKRKFERDDQGMTYLQFRRSVKYGYDCLMVRWCGMWLGIEKDGYTHS